jgi:hypothetical protein
VLTATITDGLAKGFPYIKDFVIPVTQYVPVSSITEVVQWVVGKEFDLSTLKVEPENATFKDIA